ncbi:MAG: metallophosphoesterase family protein [Anaerolineaceae bacterium]|nr:metallophosphoesterase family protein [Anaerolineaceae bacterium]
MIKADISSNDKTSSAPILVVGVLADTHIPDRVTEIHPEIIPTFQAAGVELILHAGDICAPAVITQLEQVAPVEGVRGNRDWVFYRKLPLLRELKLAGLPVVLTHGHGNFINYWIDKWYYYSEGYRLERYHRYLKRTAPQARVIIFGHTHYAENFWSEEQLFFNPGSASMGWRPGMEPSIGMLQFYSDGQVKGEIIKLNKYRLKLRHWIFIRNLKIS